MKKIVCIGCICMAWYASLFAQAPVDLFDPFYADVSLWEGCGLINDAPSIRPYPLQEIERLLQIVIEKGDIGQRRKATEYQARFFRRALHYGGKVAVNVAARNFQKQFVITPFLKVNYSLTKLLTVSAYVSFNGLNKLSNEDLLPAYAYSHHDIAYDSGSIGKLKILPMFNSTVTFGTPEYYATAGMTRTSYGPFHESGIFISRDAFHAGQFSFVINKEKWAYNHVFIALAATNDYKEYDSIKPNKFLSLHSLDIRPLSWLSFSLIDSMVYGGRFDPMYLLPFSMFFLGQSVYNFPDNSLLGLSATIKPVEGLRIDAALYADDLGFNEIVKFKPAKWRMSGECGVSYTMPYTHWFSFADINYTFVLPYTYTHHDHHDPAALNYQNYTHRGGNLATPLDPNSDRVQVRAKFRPLYGLDIDLSNTFIRHANVTESITDILMLKDYVSKQYTTDGSTFNYSAVTEPEGKYGSQSKKRAFLYSTPFMKQRTIQYVNQLGLNINCHVPIVKSGGEMLFKIGYVFEANINPGVRKNIYHARKDMKGWNERDIDTMSAADSKKVYDEAARQLAAWRTQAIGKQLNHYITVSAEVSY